MKKLFAAIGVALLAITMLVGCKTPPNYIIMTSGTTLGFDVSESPATASPQATLAYKRVELALVPCQTNYTPDALMEFRFESGMFVKNYIYSRVATGPNATVASPAAVMMSKGKSGELPAFTNLFFSLPSPTVKTNK
jgi:hypothetical protein